MTCSRYYDDFQCGMDLDPPREKEFQQHLDQCSTCRGEWEFDRQLATSMAPISPPDDLEFLVLAHIRLHTTPRRHWIAIALGSGGFAAASALVFILTGGWHLLVEATATGRTYLDLFQWSSVTEEVAQIPDSLAQIPAALTSLWPSPAVDWSPPTTGEGTVLLVALVATALVVVANLSLTKYINISPVDNSVQGRKS